MQHETIKIQDQNEIATTKKESNQDSQGQSLFSFDFLNDEKPSKNKPIDPTLK